jgi:hypothetical protein
MRACRMEIRKRKEKISTEKKHVSQRISGAFKSERYIGCNTACSTAHVEKPSGLLRRLGDVPDHAAV